MVKKSSVANDANMLKIHICLLMFGWAPFGAIFTWNSFNMSMNLNPGFLSHRQRVKRLRAMHPRPLSGTQITCFVRTGQDVMLGVGPGPVSCTAMHYTVLYARLRGVRLPWHRALTSRVTQNEAKHWWTRHHGLMINSPVKRLFVKLLVS